LNEAAGAADAAREVYLHLSRKHLTAVANPLDTIDVSRPESAKLSRKLQKRWNRPPFEVADVIRQHENSIVALAKMHSEF
jgi:hypothetical protein